MPAQRLLIEGRVQRVGYRDWTVATAQAMQLNGWVRNLSDGRVEVLVSGSDGAVADFIHACRTGSQRAEVTHIDVQPAQWDQADGFARLPTA